MLNNNSSSSLGSGKFSKATNAQINLVANTPVEILNANTKRMYSVFINNNDADITLVFGDKSKASLDKGIIIKGNGGSYEITLLNLFTGKISAICATDTQLSLVEGSE